MFSKAFLFLLIKIFLLLFVLEFACVDLVCSRLNVKFCVSDDEFFGILCIKGMNCIPTMVVK